jgi:serine/threonine protein kinase/cytochrome c-type biogenesis protein CcmH/NrfG
MLHPEPHWATVKRIHQAALDRPADERATFLEATCAGDEALLREVQSLLAYLGRADSFMETPAVEAAARMFSDTAETTIVGRALSHYQVDSLLGAGGMGEVYLARDPRLDRKVALKILTIDFASNEDRMLRFTREAKAASALNHPNVAVIHDVGESGGVRFIVMEYVEGHTLAEKIAGQAMPATEIIDVAMQVADALDAADARGITHRDIKPANLMLTPRGQVKVLDFGIAKMTATERLTGTDEGASRTHTAAGRMIGSPSHMSPEQILGNELDGRSDLFSLGVTMYDMATGRLPFVGATRAELMDRVLHAPPDSIAHQNAEIPLELERIIFSCLEKSVERRYLSARNLLLDLRLLKRQIDADVALGRPAIDHDAATPNPARPLEAYELVGRGRAHLLSASIFELPKAVSAFREASELDPTYAAAQAGLALALCGQATSRARPHGEAFAEAKVAALRALGMDAECADAHVALGQVLFLSEWDWLGAERSFQRALEINPNHPEAYLHYGGLMEALGDLDRGLRLKPQALERDPQSVLTLVLIAVSFWNQRRYDDTIAWLNRALDRDPTNLFARELLGGALFKKGDLEGALGQDLKRAELVGAPEEARTAWKQAYNEVKQAYEAGGHCEAVRCILKHVPGEAQRGSTGLRLSILHAEACNLDLAFEHLDRAIDTRDPSLVHLAVAPAWDNLRCDPRYDRCLRRMRLQPVS